MALPTGNCPDCAAEFLPGDNFCQDCGKSITYTSSEPPQAYRAASGAMLTCLACGCHHDSLASTCSSCGSLLKDVGVYTRNDGKKSVRAHASTQPRNAHFETSSGRSPTAAALQVPYRGDTQVAKRSGADRQSRFKIDSPLLNRTVDTPSTAASFDFFKRLPRFFVEGTLVVLLLGTFSVLFFSISHASKNSSELSSLVQRKSKDSNETSGPPATKSRQTAGTKANQTVTVPESGAESASHKDQANSSSPIVSAQRSHISGARNTTTEITTPTSFITESNADTSSVTPADEKSHSSNDPLPSLIATKGGSYEEADPVDSKTNNLARLKFNDADMASYNRLLANYFTGTASAADSTGQSEEPPTFQEWVSQGKPNF